MNRNTVYAWISNSVTPFYTVNGISCACNHWKSWNAFLSCSYSLVERLKELLYGQSNSPRSCKVTFCRKNCASEKGNNVLSSFTDSIAPKRDTEAQLSSFPRGAIYFLPHLSLKGTRKKAKELCVVGWREASAFLMH